MLWPIRCGWNFFPSAALFVHPILQSDHNPSMVDTHCFFRNGRRGRPKRFEERWLYVDDVGQITQRGLGAVGCIQGGSETKVVAEAFV